MEEILSSIRRIIADDQEAMQGGQNAGSPSPLRNVLDLAERQPSAPAPATAAVDMGEDMREDSEAAFLSREEERQHLSTAIGARYRIEQYPSAAASASTPESAPSQGPLPVESPTSGSRLTERPSPVSITETVEEALLSTEADASIFDAFARLGASVPASAPKTLEDIVKEMLRPMLKGWLDDNLPALVERLVQAEIERVTRGKR